MEQKKYQVQPPVLHSAVYVPEPTPAVETPQVQSQGLDAWIAQAGIAGGDVEYVKYIVFKESSNNPLATNGQAYGLCQALPGSKMASAGSDWATNPVTQLQWCNGYAIQRYGSWANAYNTWLTKHWW